MLTFILLSALFAADISHQSELKQTVSAYWDLMARGEKAAALKFVLEGSHNNFIKRDEPKIRTWRYVSAEPINAKEVTVAVEMEAFFRGASVSMGFQTVTKRETWVREKNKWKLRVDKPSAAAIAPLVSRTKAADSAKVLQISPSVLKVQFLNKSQVGRVVIRNGTELPAELVSAVFDETRFELVQRPSRIEAGHAADLMLHYKGTENDKNLQSQMSLVLKHGNQEKLFQVPIIYNYLSEGARGLFGLTEEQARNLKRGDKVAPAIKPPVSPGAQPPVPKQ